MTISNELKTFLIIMGGVLAILIFSKLWELISSLIWGWIF